jgi:hypothetical protein
VHGDKGSLHYFLCHHHVVHQQHGHLGKSAVMCTVEHGYGLVSVPFRLVTPGASAQHPI